MKFKKYYLNLAIKFKFIFITYSIVIIVAIILGFFFYSTSQRYVINKVSSTNLNIVRQINTNLSSLQSDMNDLSTYLSTAGIVSSFLKSSRNSDPASSGELFTKRNDLNDLMMKLVVTKKYLNLIALYNEGSDYPLFYNINDSSSSGISQFPRIKESTVYKNIRDLNGGPYWFFIDRGASFAIQNNKNPKLALGRLIKDPNDYSPMGLLLIGANEQEIRSIYASVLQSSDGGIVITDNGGNIISKSGLDFYQGNAPSQSYLKESALSRDGFTIDAINGSDMLIAFSSDNPAGWKVFFAVPTKVLTTEMNSLKLLTVVVIAVCILLSLPFILLAASYITSPLLRLLKSMKKLQHGNFDEKVLVDQKDEVGQLSVVYNTMVSEIKRLIEQNYVLQIKEREAELNALQAQINPHFLYNTLDTIFWEAQASGQKDIGQMVYSLSKLFRLSLNRGKGWTTVKREKELLEHYLLLQKIRFQEKLSYEFNVEDSILNYSIPKLILQPFVENAILHGLESKGKGGSVAVTGYLRDNCLFFTIEDDGVGMDEEKIQGMFDESPREIPDNTNLAGGYAVRNIDERLRINYKGDYMLKFTSSPGCGTKVELKIPAVEAPGEEDVKDGQAADCGR